MAYSFGDGFDLYAAPADAFQGYWDSGNIGSVTYVAGRFAGSQAMQWSSSPGVINLAKSSGANDAVHHFVVAFRQTAAISGAGLGLYLQLLDGTNVQCSIVFRSDGAILLTSGLPIGTVLATYTGAVTASNTWYAFEFEVVINNTTGAFRVRKNGNTVNDFDSGAVLNTRPGSANNYANKLQISMQTTVSNQQIDDLFWRSDASAVAWMGDVRCYTRMPASDASVQFSRTPTSNTQTPFAFSTTNAITNGIARYTYFTAAYDGTIGSATVSLGTGYTGNMKCSIFSSIGGNAPGAVLGSASPISNPAAGSNTFTFGTPVNVAKGVIYCIGFDSDTTSGTWNCGPGAFFTSTTPYASFPVASPTTAAGNVIVCSLTITTSSNSTVVNETQQDAATSYVYDSTPGDADFYSIGSIASTPLTTIAVTTRGYMQKSDAGSRTAAVQLKSGASTVASPTLTLTTSGWLWTWRMDLTDPNTSAAWTAAAVNAATIGPTVVS